MDHNALNLPLAPQWSLVAGSLGRSLVLAGVILFALSAVVFVADRREGSRWGGWLFGAGCASIFGAFAILATLFATDQFHFRYVYAHSEKVNGLPYKIAAVWSGQEGSFLLWATTSALFALLSSRGTGPYRRAFGAVAAVFLSSICGILAYESPFVLQMFEGKAYAIPNGVGLAPSLNNYWVIIHPPTIFLGFGLLIVPFAFAVAALVRRDYDDWVSRVRPWAILGVGLLGLGLCMGGFWAYETLGWGGFWKWDPVENVSFVPWLLLVVLIHGLLVQSTKGKWRPSNLLFAGLPFLVFCYGTFLTRAGFLDKVSVHSFAQMNASAHKVLLWFLILASVGFLGLWLARLKSVLQPSEASVGGLTRAGFFGVGNSLVAMFGLAVAIGMSVPLIQFAMGKTPKVVEEALYHRVVVWFFVPIMLLMAIAPFAPWRQTGWREILGRVLNAFSLSLFVMGIVLIVGSRHDVGFQIAKDSTIDLLGTKAPLGPWIFFLGWLCAFTLIANVFRLVDTIRRAPLGVGPFLSHIGVALAMAGLIVSRGLERHQEYALQPGLPAFPLMAGTPSPTLELIPDQKFDFFNRKNKVRLKVSGDGPEFVASPGLSYSIAQSGEPQPITWPHIQRWASHDLYLVLHPLQPSTGSELTLKPGETGKISATVWSERKDRTYTIRYRKMVREGEAGMAGTKFGAQLEVVDQAGTQELTPKIVLGKDGGPSHEEVGIDDQFSVRLERMNAADQSVTLTLAYKIPVFPVELYYKPLTILVWLGVGILAFGGFVSAFDRRRRRRPDRRKESPITEEVRREDDALVPVS